MIELATLRELLLDAAPQPDRAAHLAAASGLVVNDDTLYVVADDELHLGVFPRAGAARGRLLRLVDGELPDAPDKRKKRKADFEALVRLPPFGACTHGALFALGSGSGGKKPRSQGVLLALDAAGALAPDAPRAIDLSDLHARLRDEVDGLNIEGAVVSGEEFILVQRGNKGRGRNATLHFALADLLRALARGDAPRPALRAHRIHELGVCDDVPLSFTDAAALADGSLLFSAVAENTADSVADGACLGAALGRLDIGAGRLVVERLARPWKIEGLHAWQADDAIALLAVTDADDASRPALLLAGHFAAR